jgi:group I intron endonuclease
MIIYKVTNLINNKIYIGKTISSLDNRKKQHESAVKRNKYKCVFHDAIRKYGGENFCWEVLDTVMFSDLLLDLEKFYIKKYSCKVPNGYNMTNGGDGCSGRHLSEETKKKIGNSGRGKHTISEGLRKKLSEKIGEKHHWYGCHHSEISRKKIGDGNRGKIRSEETKKQYSISHKGKQVGDENPMYGRKHSEKTREKMRLAWEIRRARQCVN